MPDDNFMNELLALDFTETDEDEKPKGDKAKSLDDAQMMLHTFSTPAGDIALKKLMQVFLTKSVAKPKDDMISIGIREGQARVVRWIIQQIQIAKKG